MRFVVSAALAAIVAACSAENDDGSKLVLTFPGIPNPPPRDEWAGTLVRGGLTVDASMAETSPADVLTQAVLACGGGDFAWRDLSSDHGQELVIPDTAASRSSLACIARKVPFDFYVRREKQQG